MERRRSEQSFSGVHEASRPAWAKALDTPAERTRALQIELEGERERRQGASARIAERRTFLSERGATATDCWPILAPKRIDLLSLSRSEDSDGDGEASCLTALFRITLNDPASTRLELPVVVSLADAAAPGLAWDMDGPPRSPDHLRKAWYSLARFGRFLHHMAEVSLDEDDPVNTMMTRWLAPGACDEENEVIAGQSEPR